MTSGGSCCYHKPSCLLQLSSTSQDTPLVTNPNKSIGQNANGFVPTPQLWLAFHAYRPADLCLGLMWSKTALHSHSSLLHCGNFHKKETLQKQGVGEWLRDGRYCIYHSQFKEELVTFPLLFSGTHMSLSCHEGTKQKSRTNSISVCLSGQAHISYCLIDFPTQKGS